MPRGKKPKNEKLKNDQRQRTAKNQIRKYERLIKKNPDHKDLERWQSQVDFYNGFL